MRRDIEPYGGLTRIALQHEIFRHKWNVGDHTYGRPIILEPAGGQLKIGRFCSIASAKIILGNHLTSFVTTYPFDSFKNWWPNMNDTVCHKANGVEIGSDVWLGEDCMILPGARVGHGAVIGAATVVRGQVPPYAIFVGNPGVVLRYRFNEEEILQLLQTAWWDRPDKEINEIIPLLVSPDVKPLLHYLRAKISFSK